MQKQRRRDTEPEVALRKILHARGLRFFVDRRPLPELRRTADVVFPRCRVAVFVDGCFWHGCPQHGTLPKKNHEWWVEKLEGNRRRDRNTDDVLKAAGWRVVRVWEHEDPTTVAGRVAQAVADATRGG